MAPSLSGLLSQTWHCRRCLFRPPLPHASTSLRPFAPCPLRHFPATTSALTPVRLSPSHGSPSFMCTAFVTIPPPTTLRPPAVTFTRYPSARRVSHPKAGLRLRPRGGRLARDARPNRVRHPADWSFTSCCSPPRLSATQSHSVTGRRAIAWGGLPPPCPCTLTGAPRGRPQGPPLQRTVIVTFATRH